VKLLSRYLPDNITRELEKFAYINELRIKRDAFVCVKKDGVNRILPVSTSSDEFDMILSNLLHRSYHSQHSNIIEGFISLDGGYRVGVCGKAVIKEGRITNISDIISLSVRIPHSVKGVCLPVCEYLERSCYLRGVLIYSPPGVGKTTLLRDIAMTLCERPYFKRLALIDSRRELYTKEMQGQPLIDPYIGYPKAKGIELAIRTMSPDIIICDEIGNEDDSEAILNNQSSGVPVIASAHGDSFERLIQRKGIAKLYKNAVFGCYAGITRRGVNEKYRYEITEVS